MVPLVEDWVSPHAEPVDEFLQVLESLFPHDEVKLNQHSNSKQNQPSSWKSLSHGQLTKS